MKSVNRILESLSTLRDKIVDWILSIALALIAWEFAITAAIQLKVIEELPMNRIAKRFYKAIICTVCVPPILIGMVRAKDGCKER